MKVRRTEQQKNVRRNDNKIGKFVYCMVLDKMCAMPASMANTMSSVWLACRCSGCNDDYYDDDDGDDYKDDVNAKSESFIV